MVLFQCGDSEKMSFEQIIDLFFLLEVLCWFVILYLWDVVFLLFNYLIPERWINDLVLLN